MIHRTEGERERDVCCLFNGLHHRSKLFQEVWHRKAVLQAGSSLGWMCALICRSSPLRLALAAGLGTEGGDSAVCSNRAVVNSKLGQQLQLCLLLQQ